jgi:hypothetical protein
MWKYPTEAIPAFLTIIIMPFASIAEGIVYGVLSFVLIKTLTGKAKYIPVATWILSRTPLHPALPGFRLKDAWLKRLRRGQCGHGAMRAIDLFHTIPHTSPSQFKERSRPSALRKKAETAKNCNP